MGDAKYERYDAPTGKPGYRKTSGFKADVKQIVADVARAISPRVIRQRNSDIDDSVRMREGQSTDSNNKY